METSRTLRLADWLFTLLEWSRPCEAHHLGSDAVIRIVGLAHVGLDVVAPVRAIRPTLKPSFGVK
jgi:hypothetical protein